MEFLRFTGSIRDSPTFIRKEASVQGREFDSLTVRGHGRMEEGVGNVAELIGKD